MTFPCLTNTHRTHTIAVMISSALRIRSRLIAAAACCLVGTACLRMDAVRPHEIARIDLGKDIGVYTNEAADITLPRIYRSDNGYAVGPCFHITHRGTYLVDAKNDRVLLAKGDRIVRSYAHIPPGAVLKNIDERGNAYFSSVASRAVTNTFTNVIRAPATNDDPNAEINDESETNTTAKAAAKITYQPVVYLRVENRSASALTRVLLADKARDAVPPVRIPYDFPPIERVFVHRNEELIVAARDQHYEIFHFNRNGELTNRISLATLETIRTNAENGTAIDDIMLFNNGTIGILATAYIKGRPDKRIYTLNLETGAITEARKNASLAKDVPVGLTSRGMIFTMNYLRQNEFVLSRFNIFGNDRERKVLLVDRIPNLQQVDIFGENVYAIGLNGSHLSIYELR